VNVHAWAVVGAVVVFVVCAAGLWASALPTSRERKIREAQQAREAARAARAATYRPIEDPNWLRGDTGATGSTPRR